MTSLCQEAENCDFRENKVKIQDFAKEEVLTMGILDFFPVYKREW